MQWLLSLILVLACNPTAPSNPIDKFKVPGDDYLALSMQFLSDLKASRDATAIVEQYSLIEMDNLIKSLDTHDKKLAFWINTYNAFVQYLLVNDPSLFNDRNSFYTSKQINIAGQQMSFDRLEHGIIRNSRIKYGLGYIKKWFPPRYERKLRIKKRDGRVHFALNCGAISCPSITIYNYKDIDKQLNNICHQYLKKHTSINQDEVTTSPLFSWFRGDFGGKKGIKKFLKKYKIISTIENIDLRFGPYDWTLSTGNYTDYSH